MRLIAAAIMAALLLSLWPVASQATSEAPSTERVLRWITNYRAEPNHVYLPAAVKGLSTNGAFQEPDSAGVYIGFMAGVIGSNPTQAEQLIEHMLSIRSEDHWALIRAIAYSGMPEWRQLLERFADRMPARQVMVEAYLSGKLPGLEHYEIEPAAGSFFGFGAKSDALALEPSPLVMDVFWGYYYATGAVWPLMRIIALLEWSKDGNNLERLTLGSSAKFSLASNAMRDVELLDALKEARQRADEEVAPILDEVIFAAETVEVGKIRAEAAAALNELRSKGPAYKRQISWWGQMGEGAISLGCVAAAVTGQVYLGVPCVIGGALTSATLRYLGGQ
jgi:hypothetical protein